ncbi:MAG: hypothetical protein HY261_00530 [Chloroflexi bacterium]|nr:hypothetical protein [Chloroflexota bacterium]
MPMRMVTGFYRMDRAHLKCAPTEDRPHPLCQLPLAHVAVSPYSAFMTPWDWYNQNRQSIRLPEYDYHRTGWYFVTLCTFHREALFGEVTEGRMVLNEAGKIVERCWWEMAEHFDGLVLDAMVVMPNHLHGLVGLAPSEGRAHFKCAPTKEYRLGDVVRAFKVFSTRTVNKTRGGDGLPLWQRNFHEHVLRRPEEMVSIRRYIRENPQRWNDDSDNPRFLRLDHAGPRVRRTLL